MNSQVLEITGMTCDACASHVEKALLGVRASGRPRCPTARARLA